MVLAFGDDLKRTKWPIATWSISFLACVCFGLSALSPDVSRSIVSAFAFIPLQFSIHPVVNAYRLVTAEFLHQNLLHLLGNLLFLVALGRSVESTVGPTIFASAFMGWVRLVFSDHG
jgi:membrane associated rhomboid family serine protease